MSKREHIFWIVFAIGAFMLAGLLATTPARACECCPEPVVKVEWHDEWVYEIGGPETVVVTGTERLLCYEVVSQTAITEIRTKAGQDIECIYPQGEKQASGCIEAGRHDLSNVSFCNDGTTAVELSTFTVRSEAALSESGLTTETAMPRWIYMAAFVFGMLSTAVALVVGIVIGQRTGR